MKKVKLLSVLLSITLVVGILAGCGSKTTGGDSTNQSTSDKKVEVNILMGKPEVAKQFEDILAEYNKESKTAKVSMVPLGGQNAYEKMTALYASNNAPTISMVGQEFESFKDKFLDLGGESWVKNAMDGTLDYVKDDNKVLGMPVTVEAFGFIYNKKVLDEAVGGSFDPAMVKTTKDLEDLFKKIEAKGKQALHISPMDWSLGAHLTNIFFTTQSQNRDDRHKFMSDLKAGNVSLKDNKLFNGWLDTFDLMKKYNSAKASPLSPQYEDGPQQLATGQVGMWFMGNWAYPQIKELDDSGEYGFLPVPVSNNAYDYGNSQISVGVPSYWCVDASQSSKEQQEEAKKFLSWLVNDPKGQDGYVNSLNFIPIYTNITLKPADPISNNILKYMSNKQTLEWMNNYYPADGWPKMGASMQKYLDNKIDRNGLVDEFEAYWKTAK
ncbi:ABC transporter substrate-binding protein [Clostridium beijerinckii]|uniref:ABC transporter substrate-binding protein n=1 Tax=Clostridium beijerinckii TaxID=1520 RepID=A0A0B5QHS1_CLOBE|nr:ABC transporter substrate-binding protein [Clostridium beijerinckii]AJH01925.1 ABC transporter substrate-binding protein [Clostridium beijerinckii]